MTSQLTSAEKYFILDSLGILERFRTHWDHPDFFAKAGLALEVIESQRRSSLARVQHNDGKCLPLASGVCCAHHDWLSKAGDLYWAAGKLDLAKQHFQLCIDEADGREFLLSAGVGGLTRFNFALGNYTDCIKFFRLACPPHSYYTYQHYQAALRVPVLGLTAPTDYSFLDHECMLPSFVSKSQYMCRAIIAAALRSGGLDNDLRVMITDYFDITSAQLADLEKSLAGDSQDIESLKRQVAPTPVKSVSNLNKFIHEGDTDKARRVRNLLPHCSMLVDALTELIDDYLLTGTESIIDDMLNVGSAFGIPRADALVLSEALDARKVPISKLPARRLSFLRRFSPICSYHRHDYLADYLKVMEQLTFEIEPRDIISAIIDLQWYKTSYSIDYTGIGGDRNGFGKTEISDNREWLELILRGYSPAFDRAEWASRESAIDVLHRAYQYMRTQYKDVRGQERWVNEALLGDALTKLFGAEEVYRHARPAWLSPQHFDYYLPNYLLAIEYMGAQHFHPIEFFGGSTALEETKVRDERKRSLCERMGVTLVYVNHTEDVGRRAKEIYLQFRDRKCRS